MRKQILAALFLVFFSLFAISAVYAGDHGKSSGCDKSLDGKILYKAHFFISNQEELALSDDQVKKIKDIKMAVKKDVIKRDAEIEMLKIDVEMRLYDDNINVGEVDKLIDEKYDLKKAKAKYLVGKYAELKGILTPEQMKSLKALWKKCDKK